MIVGLNKVFLGWAWYPETLKLRRGGGREGWVGGLGIGDFGPCSRRRGEICVILESLNRQNGRWTSETL